MQDFSPRLDALHRRLGEAAGYLRTDDLAERRSALELEAADPDLWTDQDRGRRVQQELAGVVEDLDLHATLLGRLEDASTLAELAVEEDDDSFEAEIEEALVDLEGSMDALELRSLFSGEYDAGDAVCHLQSGAGGTDAQDWAEMMLRMYARWAEKRGFSLEPVSSSEGTEAGISSAEFIVRGRYAYGLLQGERGVHRLVRISPFNKEAKRQTAFASLHVVPFVEDVSAEIEIDEGDLRIDTYRSSGAGGQHVNVTDSAVRITHLPTGIMVVQAEKSQHQNRARAMQILRARLYDMQRSKADEERSESRKLQVGSGDRSERIRTYNFPQGRLTDHRINLTLYKLDRVMMGELDEVISALISDHQSKLLANAGNDG